MQTNLPDSRVMRRASPLLPIYEVRGLAGDAQAKFANGGTLRVDRNRERSYPGLASEAPPTASLYADAARLLSGARRILDAGCGAGAGSQLLCQQVSEVIGIDKSTQAIAFARNVAPDAKFFASDLAATLPAGAVDAAIMIDVLGHVASPEKVLITLRGTLPLGRKIFIAEPAAFPAQYLRAPARRAFSQRTLTALLTICGYEILSWERTEGTFLSCVASPFSDPTWEALRHGMDYATAGNLKLAQEALGPAKGAARPELALEAWLVEAALGLAERSGDRAIVAYFKGRELVPSDARPLAGLARVGLATGDLKEASQFASAAERLDPTDIDVAIALALVAERMRASAAHTVWGTTANLAPDSIDVALALAQAAVKRQDFGLAVWALERVRAYGDDHGTSLHLALASALLGADRRADALLEAQLAEKIDPADPRVIDILRQLEP